MSFQAESTAYAKVWGSSVLGLQGAVLCGPHVFTILTQADTTGYGGGVGGSQAQKAPSC